NEKNEKTPDAGLTVFLAKATDDLDSRHDVLKRYFDQHRVRVLPNKNYNYAAMQAELDEDLNQCSLFVQMLSEHNGDGFPKYQYERALAAGLPVLQWRSRDVKPDEVSDRDHRAFLKKTRSWRSLCPNFKRLFIKNCSRRSRRNPVRRTKFWFLWMPRPRM
ncbi:MAG: hypothetical protein GY862_18780, partial [Gammaproteobacteria bacterium]|nr:hypothetical protein [Gammaproteobacteria bacterium]